MTLAEITDRLMAYFEAQGKKSGPADNQTEKDSNPGTATPANVEV